MLQPNNPNSNFFFFIDVPVLDIISDQYILLLLEVSKCATGPCQTYTFLPCSQLVVSWLTLSSLCTFLNFGTLISFDSNPYSSPHPAFFLGRSLNKKPSLHSYKTGFLHTNPTKPSSQQFLTATFEFKTRPC